MQEIIVILIGIFVGVIITWKTYKLFTCQAELDNKCDSCGICTQEFCYVTKHNTKKHKEKW